MKTWQRFLVNGAVCTVMAVSGLKLAEYVWPMPQHADSDRTFIYACGYVDGQHRIMDITNVPGPHMPSSSGLCEKARAIAKANGFDPK